MTCHLLTCYFFSMLSTCKICSVNSNMFKFTVAKFAYQTVFLISTVDGLRRKYHQTHAGQRRSMSCQGCWQSLLHTQLGPETEQYAICQLLMGVRWLGSALVHGQPLVTGLVLCALFYLLMTFLILMTINII